MRDISEFGDQPAERFTVVGQGLDYPEGPVMMPDGNVLVVEVRGGTIKKVDVSTGAVTTIASPGGGCNGAAFGPDGKVYICNDGGFSFMPEKIPDTPASPGYTLHVPMFPSADYKSGSIQRVDVQTGVVETLFTSAMVTTPYTGANPVEVPLSSPDDLVFDASGGFWFTDFGKLHQGATPAHPQTREVTHVYYVDKDLSAPKTFFPYLTFRSAPNGIALSPKNDRLYIAETYSREIHYWKLDPDKPGTIIPNLETVDGAYLLTAEIPSEGTLDSMAVDEEGNLYVATMLPKGLAIGTPGGITVIAPENENVVHEGKVIDFILLRIPGHPPDPFPSNICFGGADRRTAYITMGGTGLLVSCEMSVPGKRLNFGH